MCGIAGVYYLDGRAPDKEVLRRVGRVMRHRGPDDESVFVHDAFGMVHRRLSIIDLETGQQPIFNEAGTVATIFNGEIYDYQHIRDALKTRGHRLATSSDTEVLVHLYEETGNLDFVKQLNGMFAFAIYDLRSRTLWLARDRTGKKPLYYYSDGRLFAFASELQALRQLPGLNLTLNPRAVDAFLRYNYVPSPQSIYREVRKLSAAHVLKLEAGHISTYRYWRMPPPHAAGQLSDEAFQGAFHEHLTRAVSSRMRSDVPLGAFLSGGLDSTTVVMLMSDRAGPPVCTFSVGFGSRSFDESNEASEAARALGTDHYLEMQERIDVNHIDRILWHFGEPFGDSSAIPTYYLCNAARKHVTVALSGDGADEVLGGYNRYVASRLASRWFQAPSSLRPRWPLRWIAALPEGGGYYGDSLLKKLKLLCRFIGRLEENPANIMPIVVDDVARSALYTEAFREAVAEGGPADPVLDVVRHFSGLGLTERMLWSDLETYLGDDILVKVDRMSMAHSLEVRCPFLDVRLLEFLSTVPLHLKIRGSGTKRLLRKFVGQRLPQVARRGKHGFEAPVGDWIKGDLRERVDDLFASSWAAEYFERSRLVAMLDGHRTGGQDLSKQIWTLFVLLQWAESQKSDLVASEV